MPHLRPEVPTFARVVRRTALSFGGACAFVAFGAATAQASESGLLDTVDDAVGEVTAPVENIVNVVEDTLGVTAPTSDASAVTESVAPEPEPEPAPVVVEPAPEPEPEPAPVVVEPVTAEASNDEPAQEAHEADDEGLLTGLVDDVADKPLASLTDVARQIVQLEGSADDALATDESRPADVNVSTGENMATGEELLGIGAGQSHQTTNLVGETVDVLSDAVSVETDDVLAGALPDIDDTVDELVGETLPAVVPTGALDELATDQLLTTLGADALGGGDLVALTDLATLTGLAEPVLTSVTTPLDQLVSTTAVPILSTVTDPVTGIVDTTAGPVLTTITTPVGAAVDTLIDPAGGLLSDALNVQALDGITGQVAGLLPIVTEPLGVVVAPVSDLLAPVTAAVAPVLEPVTTMLATALAPITETVGAVVAPLSPVLDPILELVSPVVAPLLEALEPVTTALAPITAPLLDVLEPVLEVLDPIVEPLLDPLLDELDPVLADLGLLLPGENTAWELSAPDHLGATSLPALAGEIPAATPAALTGFARAGADLSTTIVIPTTAGVAPAGNGQGVPPAVGSASSGGSERPSNGHSTDLYGAAPLLIASMFLRRERCGTAALTESLRQPGVRPD